MAHMNRRMREMTIQQLVLSMFRATAFPVTNEEYRLLGISRLNILKKRRFSNIYGALLLFLMRLSIPEAFPDHSSEILRSFDMFFRTVYGGYGAARKRVEERLGDFGALVKMDDEEPFLNLALHISEMFKRTPKKFAYAANLNKRIKELYSDFITVGKQTKIKAE